MKVVAGAFQDHEGLKARIKHIQEIMANQIDTRVFLDEFDADCRPYLDDIHKSNPSIMSDNCINYLKELNFATLWQRMDEAEQAVFWKHQQSLCQCCSMIKACGDSLPMLEQVAAGFVQENQGKSFQECQSALINDIFSGGSISADLLQTLQQPANVKSLLSNVADVFRGVDGLHPELSEMLKHMQEEQVEEQETAEDQKEDLGALFSDMLKTGDMDNVLGLLKQSGSFMDQSKDLLNIGEITDVVRSLFLTKKEQTPEETQAPPIDNVTQIDSTANESTINAHQ